MKIKSKVAFGTIVLFLFIVSITAVGTVFIYRLSNQANQIIKDNYHSLEYCRELQQEIDKLQETFILKVYNLNSINIDTISAADYKEAELLFDKYLLDEEHNITEPGEKEAVTSLKDSYQDYLSTFDKSIHSDSQNIQKYIVDLTAKHKAVKSDITDVFNINLGAMSKKNEVAKSTGSSAIWYISIIGGLTIVFAFTLLLNFPGYIANPVSEITEKIKEIANKNYNQFLPIRSKDEFGEMAHAFNEMAKRLQEYEETNVSKLMIAKGRVDSIVKNLNEGIILLDEEYNIKVINPIALDLLGLKLEEVLDKKASDISVQNDLFRELIKDVLSGNTTNSKPLRITLDKEENFFQKEIFRVKSQTPQGDTETSGYIISLKNITEYKKLDLAKTNFISIVSHELRTPISSINMSLKLLQDLRLGNLNEEQNKLVNSVKDETFRLSKITGELLDISQVETGNIRLTIETANPVEVVTFTTDVFKNQLTEKNLKLETDISSNLPNIKADIEKTVWVMSNLVANAIRYTPVNGKIKVAVHQSLQEIQFSVEDNGPGIDSRNFERIFKRFVQIDNSKKREGVGLGLAISKEFIEEQGGKIWLESELGVGSKFVFTLPVA